jgi:hypothetical protein
MLAKCRIDRSRVRLEVQNGKQKVCRLRRNQDVEDRFKGEAHLDFDQETSSTQCCLQNRLGARRKTMEWCCRGGEFCGVRIVRVNGQEESNREFNGIPQE